MFSRNTLVITIFTIAVLVILYFILCMYKKININTNNIVLIGKYINTNLNKPVSSNYTSTDNQSTKKNDNQEKGIKKFAIYHMKGCGHCHNFMDTKQENGMSKCEELRDIYKDNSAIEILDFQYGRDAEAKKFSAFPTFRIITENGITEYSGKRDITSIIDAIEKTI